MADSAIDVSLEPSRSSRWAREYPPLLTMVIALLIAFLVLPSSLNLPNSNPTTVLEFAPVPPEDDDPPPDAGSLSSLGLGSSDSLSAEADVPINDVPLDEPGKGTQKSNKKCVKPPSGKSRQTEDPNSPDCVSFYDGDNGGATWLGVTAEEVKILIYGSGGTISDQSETEGGDTSAGEETPGGVYCDIDKPSEGQAGCNVNRTGDRELSSIRAIRALASHFNERYQTYKRRLHFVVYWGCASNCAVARKSEAAANHAKETPFAVVDVASFGGFNDAYAETMARRNAMVFGSFGSLANRFYLENAPFVWSFWPDVEHDVDFYVDYVCNNIVPYPVSHAGDDKDLTQDFNGKPRKYAFMSTTDNTKGGLIRFYQLAKPRLQECGAAMSEEVFTPTAGYTNDSGGDQQYATRNVAEMDGADVTTVLWMAGMEPKTSRAMDAAKYYPEIVVAGDRHNDDQINGRAQNQDAWDQAWTATSQLREDRFADTPARQAYRQADPSGRQIHEYYATLYYRDMFTMIRGIQVAGPRLSPNAVDQGSHAIQSYQSTSPFAAACFYDASDYSCVKDIQVQWWDSEAPDPNGETVRGCWRMVDQGKRYLLGELPRTNLRFDASKNICNAVKGTGTNRLPV